LSNQNSELKYEVEGKNALIEEKKEVLARFISVSKLLGAFLIFFST